MPATTTATTTTNADFRRACERLPWVINFTAVDEATAAASASGNDSTSTSTVSTASGAALSLVQYNGQVPIYVYFYGVAMFVFNVVVGLAMLLTFVALKNKFNHTRVRSLGAPISLYGALVA